MTASRPKYVASFAYILGRVAHADLDISREESREMERLVEGWGACSEEQAVLVVEIAKTQNRLFGSTENFLVTREFRRVASPRPKGRLVELPVRGFFVGSVDFNRRRQRDSATSPRNWALTTAISSRPDATTSSTLKFSRNRPSETRSRGRPKASVRIFRFVATLKDE